jgi:hypothetical protein
MLIPSLSYISNNRSKLYCMNASTSDTFQDHVLIAVLALIYRYKEYEVNLKHKKTVKNFISIFGVQIFLWLFPE